MNMRNLGLLVAGLSALAATAASAEPVPGWYGGVDLGYSASLDRSIIVSEAECARRGGRVDTAAAGGPRCTIPRFPLRDVVPEGHRVEGLGDIGWLSSDEGLGRLSAACERERGRVVSSGLYRICRMPSVATRR